MTGKKILAIDDEREVLELLEIVLEENDFVVETAVGGQAGLIRARGTCPDLILLDLVMPDMDGWETLRQLKEDEASRAIPVVVLSARAKPRDKIRAFQEGAADYLTKPLKTREEVDRLRAILRRERP